MAGDRATPGRGGSVSLNVAPVFRHVKAFDRKRDREVSENAKNMSSISGGVSKSYPFTVVERFGVGFFQDESSSIDERACGRTVAEVPVTPHHGFRAVD